MNSSTSFMKYEKQFWNPMKKNRATQYKLANKIAEECNCSITLQLHLTSWY